MPMKPKEMIKFLLRNGFVEIIRGKGSHRKFFNKSTGITTLVQYNSKDFKKVM